MSIQGKKVESFDEIADIVRNMELGKVVGIEVPPPNEEGMEINLPTLVLSLGLIGLKVQAYRPNITHNPCYIGLKRM